MKQLSPMLIDLLQIYARGGKLKPRQIEELKDSGLINNAGVTPEGLLHLTQHEGN